MSVQSAAGTMKITVKTDGQGDPWIETSGGVGCFRNSAIEALIAELAESIGKVATLTDKPEPVLTFNDLEPGTVFRFYPLSLWQSVFIKLGEDTVWHTGKNVKQHTSMLPPLSSEVAIVVDGAR